MLIKNNIYYFSGTGNSLIVSRKPAKLIGGTIKSIPQAMFHMQNEKIGSHIIIVFPSYLAMLYGIPVIVKDFVESIPDLPSKNIVAVCSCGGYEIVNAVPSVKLLAKIIRDLGGKLFDYYTLRLPMNNLDYDHIPIPIEKNVKVIIEKAERKIKVIAKNLQKLGLDAFKMMGDITNIGALTGDIGDSVTDAVNAAKNASATASKAAEAASKAAKNAALAASKAAEQAAKAASKAASEAVHAAESAVSGAMSSVSSIGSSFGL
jgi:hypothetical protein